MKAKIIHLLSALSVLFVLFFQTISKSKVYAGCTWRCAYDCAQGEVECRSETNQYCNKDYIYCCTGSCPSAPTPTKKLEASPTTYATPTPGGARCNNITPRSSCDTPTNYCMITYCGCTCNNGVLQNCRPQCSAICRNGYCYVTQPTTTPNPSWTDIACDQIGWGQWSACTCSQSAYAGCSQTNYCGQVRFCLTPPNSNQYQINCCIPGSGGG